VYSKFVMIAEIEL